MTQIWVYALVAIALLQTVATVVLYYWLGGHTETASTPAETTPAPETTRNGVDATVDDDGVVCQNCGATNAPGYRYCRQCVQQLGRTAPTSADDDDGPENPWIR